ncbi:trypsin-like peptidase domain-containing protein [Lipingzhangella sp. LS1_29]|uniref:Trypsin-like peptidase domain-containing protein n=1 Tax=Lipingzhangella rawalii TaxID=2055835 RepID=A0ABU2H3J9_9ACTN|nr:trypsin-like peptidase domain-containing protein [Lipingzhangella rawalii]MDS1269879.1 trypsin-like peptidase domain-containing protein [Lipingzhangella rawalii]
MHPNSEPEFRPHGEESPSGTSAGPEGSAPAEATGAAPPGAPAGASGAGAEPAAAPGAARAFAASDAVPSAQRRHSTPRLIAIAAGTALVTSLVVGPAAALATTHLLGERAVESSLEDTGGAGDASGSLPSSEVSEVANTALPSVVSIEAGQGGGSGVVISSDGQILTNNHVATAGPEDELTVRFNDGTDADAQIVGADPVSDLAVIQAENVDGLTPATFGDSDELAVGADVVAIGSPLGLSGSVTSGVVSAVERPVNTGLAEPPEGEPEELPFGIEPPTETPQAQTTTVIDAIQTDAPINPGNSGGPLMNAAGEVIGINTAIASMGAGGTETAGSIGLGFAIPINQAAPIAEELSEGGPASYATLGATVTDAQNGAGVVDVASDGAADEAGIESGDVITQVDDRAVPNADTLIAAVRSNSPGDTVTVTVLRDGDTHEVEVELTAQSADSVEA